VTGEAAGLAMGLCELGGKSVSDIGDTKAPSSPEPPGLPVEREQGLSTSDLNIRQAVAQSVHSNNKVHDCELCLNNHQAYHTSSLLKDYCSLDPRVRTVGVAFRYWASVVRMER
jgi:hypothetical protein